MVLPAGLSRVVCRGLLVGLGECADDKHKLACPRHHYKQAHRRRSGIGNK